MTSLVMRITVTITEVRIVRVMHSDKNENDSNKGCDSAVSTAKNHTDYSNKKEHNNSNTTTNSNEPCGRPVLALDPVLLAPLLSAWTAWLQKDVFFWFT